MPSPSHLSKYAAATAWDPVIHVCQSKANIKGKQQHQQEGQQQSFSECSLET